MKTFYFGYNVPAEYTYANRPDIHIHVKGHQMKDGTLWVDSLIFQSPDHWAINELGEKCIRSECTQLAKRHLKNN